MIEKELHIPSDAHDILRDYAAGPHYTDDLMIETSNRVERALVLAGIEPTKGYSAGVLTRRFSCNEIKGFPDERLHYLRQPFTLPVNTNIIPWVPKPEKDIREQQKEFFGAGKISAVLRSILQDDMANSVNARPEEIGNGYIKRLLDRPDISNLLVQYYNEHQMEKFREYIAPNPYYRLGRQRLMQTNNRARHEQPASLGSYIARVFCPTDMHAVVSRGPSPGMREVRLATRIDLIRHLPLDPDRISQETLKKLGLVSNDIDKYTPGARRRLKMAVIPQFLELLSQAELTDRPHGGSNFHETKKTARVITLKDAHGDIKIGIFSTVSDLVTRVTHTPTGDKNRHHLLADTRLAIFGNIEEAISSQENALESMSVHLSQYDHLWNRFADYLTEDPTKKPDLLGEIITEARKVFAKKEGFYDKKILRYLNGSDEGKSTVSVLENPSLVGNIRRTLKQGMRSLKGKMTEIELVKKSLEKA